MSHDSLEMVVQDTRLRSIRRWLHDVTGFGIKMIECGFYRNA